MAEYILKDLLEKKGIKADVGSAGTNAVDGSPINMFAATVLASHGIQVNGFSARKFTPELGKKANVIVCMSPLVATAVKSKKATDFSRLYGFFPIEDPYGFGLNEYEKTYKTLYSACCLLCEDIASGKLIDKIKTI